MIYATCITTCMMDMHIHLFVTPSTSAALPSSCCLLYHTGNMICINAYDILYTHKQLLLASYNSMIFTSHLVRSCSNLTPPTALEAIPLTVYLLIGRLLTVVLLHSEVMKQVDRYATVDDVRNAIIVIIQFNHHDVEVLTNCVTDG